MTLLELLEHKYRIDPEYRRIRDYFRQRIKDIILIKKFAMENRGWPEEEAIKLANDIVSSGKSINEFIKSKEQDEGEKE
jgi:hypothetical protein